MPVPPYYDKNQVGEIYRPDVNRVMDAVSRVEKQPSENDTTRRLLLLVDAQIDFIHPEGSLHVPGAVADTQRTIEWLYKNVGEITTIAASLDSHIPIQIFYPTWWVNDEGGHPDAYTVISKEDVQSGKWKPLYEPEWSKYYVEKLEEDAKKQLMIWPFHTMLGSQGHNLMPAIYEAIAYHTAMRESQPKMIVKGMIAKSEFYSLLEPEIKVEDHPQGQINESFIEDLKNYDSVYIAGQAKSHCVLETVTSLMHYFEGQPEYISKFNVLMDCTSSVQHPDIDFDAIADEAYADFAKKGLHLVTSTDALK